MNKSPIGQQEHEEEEDNLFSQACEEQETDVLSQVPEETQGSSLQAETQEIFGYSEFLKINPDQPPPVTSTQQFEQCDASVALGSVVLVLDPSQLQQQPSQPPVATNYVQDLLNELRELRNDLKSEKESNQRMLKKMDGQQEKNQAIILRLTQEVVALTEEIRQCKKMAPWNTAILSEDNLLPELPMNTMVALSEFDKVLLDNTKARSQLKQLFSRCERETPADRLRFNLRKFMTDELSRNYTWNGTKDKPSIKTYFFVSLLKGTCLQMFTFCSEHNIDQIIQQHFLNAADRINKKKAQRPSTKQASTSTSSSLPTAT